MAEWVYKQSEPSLWTVGYYAPNGNWWPESDWGSDEEAAQRCQKLNGGNDETAQPQEIQASTEATPFGEWSIVELMGHRRLAGYLTEQEIAGKGFLRLEIPAEPPATQFYSPAAVYCITPTSEETARSVAAHNQPTPVQRWELPAAPSTDEYDEGPF